MNKSNNEKFKKELDDDSFSKVSGGMGVTSGLVTKDQRLDQIALDRKHRFEDNEETRKNVGFAVDKTVDVVDAALRIAAVANGVPVPPSGGRSSSTGSPASPALPGVPNPVVEDKSEAPGSGAPEAPSAPVKSPLDQFL